MKRLRSYGGYTIIETLIFLAVSAALFVATMLLLAGMQQKTEFTQAVRELQTQLQDTANDVATGYYYNTIPKDRVCRSNPTDAEVIFSTAPNPGDRQGQNQGCIFVGKMLQFKPKGVSPDSIRVFTMVGKQKHENGKEVQSLGEARPIAIAKGQTTHNYADMPDAFQTIPLKYGLEIAWVRAFFQSTGVAPTYMGVVGFYSTFQNYSPAGSLSSGSNQVQMVIPRTNNPASPVYTREGMPTSVVVDRIDNMFSDSVPVNPQEIDNNPIVGVEICVNSSGTDQYAVLRMGGKQKSLTVVDVEINSGACLKP